MPSVGLVLTVLAFLAAGPALGKDENGNAIAKLAQAGAVSCQPAHPVFCSNIHVSCAGPSSLKTFPFKLRATRTEGSIESASDTSGMSKRYARASIEWDAAGEYVLLRPKEGNGYVKLLADGRYSFRHYENETATMSRGHCR